MTGTKGNSERWEAKLIVSRGASHYQVFCYAAPNSKGIPFLAKARN